MENNNSNIIRVSNITFDVQNNIVYKNGEEFKAEFKVLELLRYLHINNERYVALDELHKNLWSGKVVSDAAVRRVIGKLRSLLEDDASHPQFLINQPKRGYRLFSENNEEIAPIPIKLEDHKENIDDTDTPTMLLEQVVGGSSQAVAAPSDFTEQQTHFFSKKLTAITLLSLLLIPILYYCYYLSTVSSDTITVDKLQTIITIPSAKRDFAISSDGKLLAFSALVDGQFGYQIFIQDMNSGAVKQLTHGQQSIFSIIFTDNSHLAYVNYVNGRASIEKIAVSGGEAEPILTNKLAIGSLAISNDASQIFAPILENGNVAFIYQIDINSKELTRVTSSHLAEVYDSQVAISEDGQMYAVLRSFGGEDDKYLQIRKRISGDILKEIKLTSNIYHMQWQTNNTLIILDQHRLFQLNINDNHVTSLFNTNGTYTNFYLADNKRIFIQKNVPGNKFLVFANLDNIKEKVTTNYIPQNTRQTYYSTDNDKLYVVTKDGSDFVLGELNYKTNSVRPIYTSKKNIKYLGITKDGTQLLIEKSDKLSILNQKNNHITVLPINTDVIEDAFFSRDNSKILYTEKEAGRWYLLSYDVNTKNTDKIFTGYRSFRLVDDGMLLANEQGNIEFYDGNKDSMRKLPITLDYNVLYDWHANSKYIIYTKTDLNKTYINEYNRLTGDKDSYIKTYASLSPQFSINDKTNTIIYQTKSIDNSIIYEIDK